MSNQFLVYVRGNFIEMTKLLWKIYTTQKFKIANWSLVSQWANVSTKLKKRKGMKSLFELPVLTIESFSCWGPWSTSKEWWIAIVTVLRVCQRERAYLAASAKVLKEGGQRSNLTFWNEWFIQNESSSSHFQMKRIELDFDVTNQECEESNKIGLIW